MSKEPKETQVPVSQLNPESDLPPDADLEERFNDFWKNNGAGIFGGIAIGALVVISIQVFQHLQTKKEDGVQEAFAAARTVEEKAAFAGDNADHQLAALAHLQIADAQYEEANFTAASESYSEAAGGFADPTLVSRARLGQGMSLLLAGELEAGRAVLETVALNTTGLDQTRGEAAYNLAVSYWESGDLARVSEVTDIILELDAPFWVFRANALRDRTGLETVVDSGS